MLLASALFALMNLAAKRASLRLPFHEVAAGRAAFGDFFAEGEDGVAHGDDVDGVAVALKAAAGYGMIYVLGADYLSIANL